VSCELIFDRNFQAARSNELQRVLMPFLVLLAGSCGSECGISIDTQRDPLSEIPPIGMVAWTIPQTCSVRRGGFGF
jgi:hypothetical protein